MELYDSELWNKSSKYTEEMHTAWRIAMRKFGNYILLLYNNLIFNIISNFTHFLGKKTYFFHLHNPNELVRLLFHVKLAWANSVFAEQFRYLFYKCQITQEDWNKRHFFLLG